MADIFKIIVPLGAFGLSFLIVLLLVQTITHNFGKVAQEHRRQLQILGEARSSDVGKDHPFRALIRDSLGKHVLFKRLEALLYRAGIKQDIVDLLVWLPAVLLLVFGALAILLGGRAALAFVLTLGIGALPFAYLNWRVAQRAKKFEDQFPDALDFLARALLAGHSLNLAISLAGEELAAPVGEEFKAVAEEMTFGLSQTQALENMDQRVGN